jgi:hypothetical protein
LPLPPALLLLPLRPLLILAASSPMTLSFSNWYGSASGSSESDRKEGEPRRRPRRGLLDIILQVR